VEKSIRHVGLDVHAETIAVAVAEADGEVRSLGTVPNRLESVRRLVDPQPVESVGLGIAVIAFSMVANVAVSTFLHRRARETESAALEGDAAHLRTDALTSGGVLAGLVLVQITGATWIDPVVALMVEVGWRDDKGMPLSFDDETNAYFRKWMKSSYYDLNHLNSKWGTSYKSFDEIDPCDKSIFNYAFEDKQNMPIAVKEHVTFRARIISEALKDVAGDVSKKHKDVLFAAEIA